MVKNHIITLIKIKKAFSSLDYLAKNQKLYFEKKCGKDLVIERNKGKL